MDRGRGHLMYPLTFFEIIGPSVDVCTTPYKEFAKNYKFPPTWSSIYGLTKHPILFFLNQLFNKVKSY